VDFLVSHHGQREVQPPPMTKTAAESRHICHLGTDVVRCSPDYDPNYKAK